MATATLRDRDAIVTREGLIFRVFGYSHPPDAFIGDVEYAPETIFQSSNPKAPRQGQQNLTYKFYEDEGWRFVQSKFPQYAIFHEMLHKKVAGVKCKDIAEPRKPEVRLQKLLQTEQTDQLLEAMDDVLELTTRHSRLSLSHFGVFGSLLHGFYHPDLSDIDLTIYGKGNIQTLRETLQEVYAQGSSPLKNEFETCETLKGKAWRFKNFSSEEYVWHQRRKQIYAVFENGKNGRKIKTEFEPVKEWREIHNDYDSETSVARIGWVKILARVVRDSDGPFIPSIYEIEPLRVLKGKKVAQEAIRILSYLEEFRMQVNRDETIEVEGNLEQVTNKKKSYYQVALTRCARYYEQVLKSTETGA